MTTKIDNHVSEAITRLPQQFKGKPKIEGLIEAVTSPVQDVEDALWQLLTERTVYTAYGTTLDAVGALVGQERGGLEDEDYQRYILARIATNRSNGRFKDLITITRLILNDSSAEVTIVPQYPASVVVRISGIVVSSAVVDALVRFLTKAVLGGVRLIVEATTIAEDDILHFDIDNLDEKQFISAEEE